MWARIARTADTAYRSRRTRALAWALAGGLLVLLAGWLAEWSGRAAPDDFDSVARDWNETIRKLGVEPAYPPEEDIHVGDLFAAISGGESFGKDAIPFAARAIKLDHIPMDDDLKDEYALLPMFPATLPKPKDQQDIWEQNPSTVELFAGGRIKRVYLPLAVFPGFTISHARRSVSGLSWARSALHALLTFEGASDDTVTLAIPSAETYGISSLTATGHLIQYCADERTAPFCTETFVRNQLSSIVGNRVREKIDGTGKFRLEVELYLVNRVYLTRSIEQSHVASRSQDAKSSFGAGRNGAAADQPGTEAAGALPGGSFEIGANDRLNSGVSRVLPRPVVFGFRAIHKAIPGDPAGGN